MNYLHYEFDTAPGDVIRVSLDRQANVRLLDQENYNLYRQGKTHRYRGGLAKHSPVDLDPPHPGRWHVVIDLGGYGGTVRAEVQQVSPVGA